MKRFNVLRDSLQICNSTPSLPSCPQQGASKQVDPQSNRPQPAQQPATQPAPQPAQHPAPQPRCGQKETRPRDSLDSTLEEDRQDSAVQSYMKSLRNFSSKPGRLEWTQDQRDACGLFEECRGTVNRNDVKKRIEEGGFVLTDAQCDRIYEKIKTAVQVFKSKRF